MTLDAAIAFILGLEAGVGLVAIIAAYVNWSRK